MMVFWEYCILVSLTEVIIIYFYKYIPQSSVSLTLVLYAILFILQSA